MLGNDHYRDWYARMDAAVDELQAADAALQQARREVTKAELRRIKAEDAVFRIKDGEYQ